MEGWGVMSYAQTKKTNCLRTHRLTLRPLSLSASVSGVGREREREGRGTRRWRRTTRARSASRSWAATRARSTATIASTRTASSGGCGRATVVSDVPHERVRRGGSAPYLTRHARVGYLRAFARRSRARRAQARRPAARRRGQARRGESRVHEAATRAPRRLKDVGRAQREKWRAANPCARPSACWASSRAPSARCLPYGSTTWGTDALTPRRSSRRT